MIKIPIPIILLIIIWSLVGIAIVFNHGELNPLYHASTPEHIYAGITINK